MIKIKITINKNIFKKGLIAPVSLIVIFTTFFIYSVSRAAITCTVTSSACDTPGDVVVLRMSDTSNAHAELPSHSTEAYKHHKVCCNNVAGLGNDCTAGTHELIGTLSGATNAHFEDSLHTVYNSANDICLSITSGTVSVSTSTDCGTNATLFSFSGTSGTNAHVGNSVAYATKVCATAAAAVVSVTLDRETFAYGNVPNNTASSTLNLWSGAGIVATNNGNVIENFDIYGANSTGSGGGWILAANTTGNNYMHQFCVDTGANCDSPPTGYTGNELTASPVPLKANVAAAGTVAFQLQITTPTTPTDVSQQSAIVTIQATAP